MVRHVRILIAVGFAALLLAACGPAGSALKPLPTAPTVGAGYKSYKVTLHSGVYKITFNPLSAIVGNGVYGSGLPSGEAACQVTNIPNRAVSSNRPVTFTVTIEPGGVGDFYINYQGAASVSAVTRVGPGKPCILGTGS